MELKKYRPSNGTEGDCFMSRFCYHCLHEQYLITGKDEDKKCNILSSSMIYGIDEDGYPSEWTYDREGKPTCLNYKFWDWDNDGDPDDPENPISPRVYDPNQISIPFIESLEVEKEVNETVSIEIQEL